MYFVYMIQYRQKEKNSIAFAVRFHVSAGTAMRLDPLDEIRILDCRRKRQRERNVKIMRKEHDFLGELQVPDEVYYGVQTMRAIDNFKITGQVIDSDFVQSFAKVKKAAALANMATGRLDKKIGEALVTAADEIIAGKMLDQFPVDPIQGGAGTSVNMNVNEVLCNRALELIGKPKGSYDIISPNNHANMAQSTNDAFRRPSRSA